MRSTLVLLIILLLTTIIFALLYKPAEPVHIPDAPKVYVEMEMSLSGIVPGEINVTLGDVVIVNLSSRDVQHSFALPEFGIFSLVIPAKSTVFNVTIPANILGEFTYQCIELTHDLAVEAGTLRVSPRPSPESSPGTLVITVAFRQLARDQCVEASLQKRPQ